MFSSDEIKSICADYNIECVQIGDLIDTSFSENDKRLNYPINDKYFLKINNSEGKTESFLSDINQLVKNYKSIGVYCPSLYKTKTDTFSSIIVKDGIKYTCHAEEKSTYKTREEQDDMDYAFKKEVLEHVGKLASKFTNHNLSQNKSMWSLIELSASDIDVDEKQENFDDLIRCLNEKGFNELVNKLINLNNTSRKRIKSYMNILPRCVYQGDLNDSNIVIDENNHFRGIIDFNMFGTEVNINCFLNESMYYIKESDFDNLSAKEIFDKITNIQSDLLSSIFKHYTLNADELEIINDYKKIIFTSFYPNAALMIKLLEQNKHIQKVIDFLNIICDL